MKITYKYYLLITVFVASIPSAQGGVIGLMAMSEAGSNKKKLYDLEAKLEEMDKRLKKLEEQIKEIMNRIDVKCK